MNSPFKRKVTVKLNFDPSSRPHTNISRPPSPSKSQPTLQPSSSSQSPPPTTTRLKARINSSATPRKPTSATLARSNASNPPRPRSPFKPQPVHARSRPASPIRTALPLPAATEPLVQTHSTPNTPDRKQYTFSDDSLDTAITESDKKMRRGSVTLHHTLSLSSLHARSASTITSRSVFNPDGNSTPPLGIPQGRVKAKVSALAQQAEGLNPLSSSPKLPSLSHRIRAPSISSSVSANGPVPAIPTTTPVFYPITTATAAANPHRFATPRASPPSGGRHHYIPLFPSTDLATKSPKFAVAKVDPSAVTPPIHSPPTSAVSFSSQSSYRTESSAGSRTSVLSFSSLPEPLENVERIGNGLALEHLDALDELSFRTEVWPASTVLRGGGEERSNEDHKIRAEAKSNRKIADLEITNRSLMAINASLESAKHRQAKEIRDLRRKLRESRLILPPRAYRAVKSPTDNGIDETDDDDDIDEDSDRETNARTIEDTYRRVKAMIELLLETGRKALESKIHDHPEGGRSGTKVLSADEVRSWNHSDNDREDDLDGDLALVNISRNPSSTTPRLQSGFASEEEVEDIITPNDALQSPIPPIHITPSP